MEIFGFVIWPERDPADPEMPEARARRRRIFLASAAGLLLAAGAAVLLRPAFNRFRAAAFMRSGEAFSARGDFASARIQFVNAYRLDPARADLYEQLARVLRAEGSPDHAICLARAYALAPHRYDLALASLQSAVEARQPSLALAVAAEAGPRFQDKPEIAYWAGAALLLSGRVAEAGAMLRHAADLSPGDDRFQIAVGTLELSSADHATSLLGKARLETLLARPDFPFRAAATRPLAQRALGTNPAEAARLWSALIATGGAAWPERLDHLDAVRLSDPARARAMLGELWSLAGSPDQKAAILLRTDALAGRAEARARMSSLKPPELLHPALLFLHCAFLETEKDWQTLDAAAAAALAESGNWTAAHRVQAILWKTLAHRRLDDTDAAEAAVRAALAATVGHTDALESANWLLARGLDHDARRFLEFAASPNSPCRFAALTALAAALQRLGDLEGLLSAAERLLQIAPFNAVCQNNVAALLLDLNRDTPRALRLAADAARAAPRAAQVQDTHARALARSGRPADALAIYARLPEDVRGHAEIRLHEAECLVLAARKDDARKILAAIDNRALPEGARKTYTRLIAELNRDAVNPATIILPR